MKKSHYSDLFRLRLIVGFLGERAQFGWWPTSFFDPASKLFLEPAFPKTSRLAQYHGLIVAARRLHDEHIGVGNVFHLFRLPEETEQNLHSLLQENGDQGDISSPLQARESAIRALASFAEGHSPGADEGPVAVGKLSDISKPTPLKAVARHYLAAFEGGFKSYPYFMG